MAQGERAFAGLESAWNPGLLAVAGGVRALAQALTSGLPTAASFRPTPKETECAPAFSSDAPALVAVLIATCPGRTSALLDQRLLATSADSTRYTRPTRCIEASRR